MSDIDSMVEQVRSSGLPQKVQDGLIRRVVREGPEFDVLQTINLERLQREKGRPPSAIVQLVFLMGLLFLVFYASSVIFDFFDRPPAITQAPPAKEYRAPRPMREDDEGGAYVWARDFVRQRLKAPRTAEFPSVWNVHFTDMGDRKWRVVSYVDAQNAFGAEVRTYYDAVVRYVGKDRWELISLKMAQ